LEPSRSALLKTELERVEELLEIEPDCKWALHQKCRLSTLCATGAAGTTSVEEACADGYTQISALDPLRKGFYDEARAESLMRVRIISWTASAPGSLLDISSLSLRRLTPCTTLAAFGVRVLDVSKNDLRELGPLLSLLSLEELRASGNRLVGDVTEAFSLPRLRCLDVSHNNMELRENAVAPPPSTLTEVNISSNPAVLALSSPDAVQKPPSGSTPFTPPARINNAPKVLAHLLGGAPQVEHTSWEAECDTATGLCICRKKPRA